jgi:hypothetical protein
LSVTGTGGAGTAVTFEGNNSSITNNGTITSNYRGIYAGSSRVISIINTGLISASDVAIYNSTGQVINTINNSGTISSNSIMAVLPGDVTNLINTGTITGSPSYSTWSAVDIGRLSPESITMDKVATARAIILRHFATLESFQQTTTSSSHLQHVMDKLPSRVLQD